MSVDVAIVGCGSMGRSHANYYKGVPEARVVALCDIKRENLEKFHKEQYKGDESIRLYDSLEEMMKDPPKGLRAVTLVTPHALHFPQAMLSLEHGYDVLVEKPMVTSSDHARQLAEQVKKTGRHLQIAFQASYSQEYAYIRDVLQAGGLGELQTVTAYSCQGWRNAVKGTWRQDPALSGGGQMYDSGAHLFNSIAWLMDRPVEEVYCWADNKGTPVDINAVMTIRWEGNILGSVTISGNTPGWQEGIWISGEKGRISTGIHGGRLEHFDEKGGLIKYPPVTQKHYTPNANFIDCLLGKAEPRCPVRYGILHSWLMDALYLSVKEGRAVKPSRPPV